MSMLISHFPSWMTDGLFARLGDWTPWDDDETVDKNGLDLEYFGNHAGLSECSQLIETMTCFNRSPGLTDVQFDRLEKVIQSKFSENWNRLWDAVHVEYNPLENYDSTETETPDLIDKTKVKSDIKTETGSKLTNKNKITPFGTSGTPVEVSETESSGDDDDNKSRTYGSDSDNFAETTHKGSKTTTRHGNIGVTTSQQMLESEYELRKRTFWDRVFSDLDSVMICGYWRSCR